MPKTTLMPIDLQLFNGAAGGATAGGATSTAGDGSAAGGTGTNLPKAENRRGGSRRNSGALSNVVYGIQDADTNSASNPVAGGNAEGNGKSGITTTSDAKEAKAQAFKELIEGEYKEEYTNMFQQAFNRRFKDVKVMESTITNQKPIMDLLAQRYKVTDGDPAKLLAAIENDSAYWEEAAEEAGLSVEQYKQVQKLQRENEQFRMMQKRQQADEMAKQKFNEWVADGDKLKATYPSFDLETECKNKDFVDLLRAGLSVQKAYELVHIEEIKNATARTAAQSAGQQMAANIKSRQSRPVENGTSSNSTALVKNDVSRLTKEDRKEIARRVARGEIIKF